MINFQQNIILENDIVLLRPIQVSDFEELLYYSETEPELWKFSLIPADGKEKLEKFLEYVLLDRNQKTSYTFVVIYKKINKIVGVTRYYDISEFHKSLKIGGTWYGKEFQGKKINNNCKYLLLDYAFENWKMKRIEFRVDINNKKSLKSLKNIGCVEEGILRSVSVKNKKRTSTVILSILKKEWINEIKDKLYTKITNTIKEIIE